MTRDKHEQEQEKTERIVQAAMAVFARRGFHRATMQDVAEEAGVGKGTTYLYFSSKDDLLDRILETAAGWYLAQLHEVVAVQSPAPDRIRGLVEAVLLKAHEQREVAQFLVEGSTGMSEDFKRRLGRFRADIQQAMRQVIDQGIAAGDIRPVDPGVLSHLVIGTVTSLVAGLLWAKDVLPGEGLPPAKRASLLTGLVMDALALAP